MAMKDVGKEWALIDSSLRTAAAAETEGAGGGGGAAVARFDQKVGLLPW